MIEALVREEEGIQKLVYYVSHIMNNPQTRYQRLEKLVLALFIISRKLKHYFQTFPITVLTVHLLRTTIKNLKATGRISKWASELRSYRLKYEPRTSIKGQLLTNFIADFTPGTTEYADQLEGWILNVDGASNNKKAGIKIVLTIPEGSISEQSFTLGFPPRLMTKRNTKLS